MNFKRLTVRIPLSLYDQIVAYKIFSGASTLNEAMRLLWQEGLQKYKIETVEKNIIEHMDKKLREIRGEKYE